VLLTARCIVKVELKSGGALPDAQAAAAGHKEIAAGARLGDRLDDACTTPLQTEGEPSAVTTALVICQRFAAAQDREALAAEEIVWCLRGGGPRGQRPVDNGFTVKEAKAGDATLADGTGAVATGIQLVAARCGATGIRQQKKRRKDQRDVSAHTAPPMFLAAQRAW
jgi:hypothetical protein